MAKLRHLRGQASRIPRSSWRDRPVPDPEWGGLVLGATEDQLRHFDREAIRWKLLGRRIEYAGLAVMLASLGWWLTNPGDALLFVVASMPFVLGLTGLVYGDSQIRLYSRRARHWGVYENGIVCPGQMNSRDSRFQPWGKVKKVELLRLGPIRFGRHKGDNWELLVPSIPYQVGVIKKVSMMDEFGLNETECERLQQELLARARAVLPAEKVVVKVVPAARRNYPAPPKGD